MKKISQEVIIRIHELKGQGYSQSQVAKELATLVSLKSIQRYWKNSNYSQSAIANPIVNDSALSPSSLANKQEQKEVGCYYWRTYKTCVFTKQRKLPPIGDTTSWRPTPTQVLTR